MVDEWMLESLQPGELRVVASSGSPGRLRVTGELDLATRDVLLAACATGGPALELEASGLSFVDCAGLAALVALARAARANGNGFTIRGAGAALRRLSAHTDTKELLGDVDSAG